MNDIAAAEQEFINTLNELEDWFLQYEYLVEMTAFMAKLDEVEKTEVNRVSGCQSHVWLVSEYTDGQVRVRAFSDSLLIRGILALILFLVNGRTPLEVAAWEMRLIEATALKEQLASDRFKGMQAVVARIKEFAAGLPLTVA